MNARFLTGSLGAILLFAPLCYSQDQPAASDKPAATDQATAEARRQGAVALKPAAVSPSQSVQQAVAFERYKELAAEREARKEGMSTSADRSADRSTVKPRPAKSAPKPKQ